jgi:hypothetical protein
MTARIKLLTLSILFLLAAVISFAQKPNLLNSTVNEIARYNIYETTNTVGYANVVSKQYQRFELLVSLATEEKLIKLATHNKSAIVRLYAFQALRRKNITIPDIMKQQFQKDNTIVKTLEGCLGDRKTVNILAMQELQVPVSFSN